MATETRTVRRHVTPRYKDLVEKEAIEEFTLDLLFEVIYASRPNTRGRKPMKNIKALIEKGKMKTIGSRESLENLYSEIYGIVRNKTSTIDAKFIKAYLYLG